jgi:hypothetical protein
MMMIQAPFAQEKRIEKNCARQDKPCCARLTPIYPA